ncbi:hypothetical protein Dimus_024385 [Dionaea muscipula]
MGRVKVHKTLEITRRFANDATIMKARRVQSVEMKPSQRFVHFLVMKNVIPRFGKRDTSSFLDLTYMDHLMARRLVNLPRVMMRHMSYVISMKDHELPYGDWLTLVFEAFGVPLVIKKGEEPKKYDFFEDTFLTMCNRPGKMEYGGIESDDQFYDAQVGEEEPSDETPSRHSESQLHLRLSEKIKNSQESTLGSYSRDARISEVPSEFERKRANRFHDELEKAKVENAKLLALLHKTQTKPHP